MLVLLIQLLNMYILNDRMWFDSAVDGRIRLYYSSDKMSLFYFYKPN